MGSFGYDLTSRSHGGRIFIINSCRCFPDPEIDDLEHYIAGWARYWKDHLYGDIMVETAGTAWSTWSRALPTMDTWR